MDSKPICVINPEAYNGWMGRRLVGAKCDSSAAVGDAREVFAMSAEPIIFNWYYQGLRFSTDRYDAALLSGWNTWSTMTVVWRKEKYLEMYYKKKCLDLGITTAIDF